MESGAAGIAEVTSSAVIVVLVELLVGFVGVPELIESKDDNEEDDEVDEDVRNEHALEALADLVPVPKRVHVQPLNNPEKRVDSWEEHEELNENVPLFVNSLNDDVNDRTNHTNKHQKEQRSNTALQRETPAAVGLIHICIVLLLLLLHFYLL